MGSFGKVASDVDPNLNVYSFKPHKNTPNKANGAAAEKREQFTQLQLMNFSSLDDDNSLTIDCNYRCFKELVNAKETFVCWTRCNVSFILCLYFFLKFEFELFTYIT